MKDVLFKTIMLKGEAGGTITSIEKIGVEGGAYVFRIHLSDGSHEDFEVNEVVDTDIIESLIEAATPSIISQAAAQTDAKITAAILRMYPVGSIYFTINNVNPSTFLGGSWVSWGAGRVPVGVDTSDSDFDTPNTTGGSKTHALTIAELPSHNHGGKIQVESNPKASMQVINGYAAPTGGDYSLIGVDYTGEAGSRMDPAHNGGGQAHSIVQPYITCYMWRRTS